MEDKLQAFKDHLCDLGYEDAVVFDEEAYVDAYIGMSHDGRVVYSYDRMIEGLMLQEGWDYEEAIEWIDYNVIRAIPYAGEKGPIVLYDDPEYMWKDDENVAVDGEATEEST